MALKANALTDLATAKIHLDIPALDTGQDSKVERFINTASQWIESYCGRKFITQTHTEYQDGRLSNRIMLREWPITGGPADGATKPELSIDSRSVFGTDSLVDVSTYFVDSESTFEIALVGCTSGGRFPRGTRNIKIIYEAGLGTVVGDDLPADLVNACLDYVLWLYDRQNDRRIGRTNKSKGDENVTYETSVPKSIIDTLEENYRRIDHAPPVGVQNS